jgi:acyl phosphate:glycerol-3-phosphate acyltransferase
MLTTIGIVAFGYVAGSIPFAFLIAWWRGRVDLREVGSRNVGATNVFRVAGLSAAATAAVFDIAKGAAVVALARWMGASSGVCASAGVAAIGGHIYPVWLRFKGGKGVATTCGVFAVLAPLATVLAIFVFAGTARVSRMISVGSMSAAICLGPLAYATGAAHTTVQAAFFAGCLVLFNHWRNLLRLAGGAEYRLGTDSHEGEEAS